MDILTAEDDYRMALTTAQFEKDYDKVYTRTVQLLDVERNRMRCMEQLLLRFENKNLQSQLDQTSQELLQARQAEIDARTQLDGAVREIQRIQGIAQTSSRELDDLRHELASLNVVASDSQKLQSEKVRLSREISSLESEVERLRSQHISATSLLAEKQNLTRQLNATEVRMEDEKRAHERTLAKGSQQTEEIVALTSKLEEARRDLELARCHAQDNAQLKSRASIAHQLPVLGKCDGGNKKPAVSKIDHQQNTPGSQRQQRRWTSTTTKVPIERPNGIGPKDPTNRIHSELTIATPGAVRAHDQQKHNVTMPGEKSSFSITPFLNRTTGLQDSMSSDDELSELRSVGDDGHLPDLPNRAKYGSITVPNTQQPPRATKQQLDKPGNQGPSSKVTLKGDARDRQKQKMLNNPDETGGYHIPASRPTGQKQAHARKRKLGLQRDRSLFDAHEEDDILQDTKKLGRKLPGTGNTSIIGNRAFTGPAGFSPLKRDRKRF
ncbi:hypothetical protein BJX99DRAFT_241245 [Aspergillus californicus]